MFSLQNSNLQPPTSLVHLLSATSLLQPHNNVILNYSSQCCFFSTALDLCSHSALQCLFMWPDHTAEPRVKTSRHERELQDAR